MGTNRFSSMTDREADSSRRTRAAKAAVLGATLALTLAACGSASSTSRKNAAAAASSGSSGITQGAGRGGRTVTGSPVVIPMITGLSGTFAETGHEEETSVQLLTKVVNASGGIAGHPVQFKVYNDQSQASVAVPLAARLIASGVQAMIVGPAVGQIQPIVNMETPKGPLILSESPGIIPKPGSFTFSTGQTPTSFAQEIEFKYFLSQGIHRVAVVYSNDPSGQQGLQEIKTYANSPQFKGKIQIVSIQTYQDTAVSATSQMEVVKAANPQAVIVWSSGPPCAIAFKALQDVGLTNIPVVSTSANEDPPFLTGSVASVLPKNLEFASALFYSGTAGLTPAEAKPIAALEAAYRAAGQVPGEGTALTWDLGLNLVAAYNKAGIHASATQLRNAMQTLRNLPGTDVTFYNYSAANHVGTTVNEYRMVKWDPSTKTFVTLSPLGG